MNIYTKFPFYDHVLGLLNPYLPMIVNDMSSNIIEYDLGDGYELDEYEAYAEGFFDSESEEDFIDEDIDLLNIAISFERGFFPDRDTGENGVLDDNEECDYEAIIKPFFTVRPYLLIGLHNNKTKQFFAEVIHFNDFNQMEILEKFALLVEALFKDESLYNKIFIMTSMSHLAIRELITFDEPDYIKGNSGEVQYVSSPYFELDNPPIHEFLIKQKHSS